MTSKQTMADRVAYYHNMVRTVVAYSCRDNFINATFRGNLGCSTLEVIDSVLTEFSITRTTISIDQIVGDIDAPEQLRAILKEYAEQRIKDNRVLVVDLTPLDDHSFSHNNWSRLEHIFSEFMENNYGVLFILPNVGVTVGRILGSRFLNRAFNIEV